MKVSFELQIRTSDLPGAGTDAAVHATLIGSQGVGPEIPLAARPLAFERGRVDIFRIHGIEDPGLVRALRLRHDNGGRSPGWHVDYALVRSLPHGDAVRATFDRWLAMDEGDGAVEATRATEPLETGGDWLEHPYEPRHGFRFRSAEAVPFEHQGQAWGLSGGMSAGLLRRLREGVDGPPESTPPRPGSDLHDELLVREQLSLTSHPEVLAEAHALQSSAESSNPILLLPTLAERVRFAWWEGLKPHLLAGPTLAVLVFPDLRGEPSPIHQVLVVGYRFFEETGDLLLTVVDPDRGPAPTVLAFCLEGTHPHGRYLADGRPIRGFFWNPATEASVRAVAIAPGSLVGATGP